MRFRIISENSVAYSPAARKSGNSGIKQTNGGSVSASRVNEIRNGFGASFRRVTPSTHVGRLSGPHFELGFSVRLNCHVGKEGEGTAR